MFLRIYFKTLKVVVADGPHMVLSGYDGGDELWKTRSMNLV